jgi:hypothetical protein
VKNRCEHNQMFIASLGEKLVTTTTCFGHRQVVYFEENVLYSMRNYMLDIALL